jgi:prevent-host-death family protein
MTVLTLPSRKVQTSWGNTIDQVKTGESVIVTQHGRDALVMLPINPISMEAMRRIDQERFTSFLKNRKATPASQKLTLEEINSLVHELRA